MKNPMTPEEQCQAIMDNAAGHDMQLRSNHDSESKWKDRTYGDGEPFNFYDYQYRRKPEPREHFRSVYSNGQTYISETLVDAQAIGRSDLVERTRWTKDLDWTPPEPEKDPNPWRPIVPDEWPECKPNDKILIKYPNYVISEYHAGECSWYDTNATEWKYPEDE